MVSGGVPSLVDKITIKIPRSHYPVQLRVSTSDIYTYNQIYVAREYDSPDLPAKANTIVDLGANIGLATIFFALRYPNARLLSVEPDPENFAQLSINVAPLGARVQTLMAAAWSRDGTLSLVREDIEGNSLDAWGVQVAEQSEPSANNVPSYSMPALMARAKIDYVDILKVDIEGAEKEIFSNATDDWLTRIGMIIVETHDRFNPGSEAAVRDAIKSTFEELPRSGENLLFRRIATEG